MAMVGRGSVCIGNLPSRALNVAWKNKIKNKHHEVSKRTGAQMR
jgi:hypothetical protein